MNIFVTWGGTCLSRNAKLVVRHRVFGEAGSIVTGSTAFVSSDSMEISRRNNADQQIRQKYGPSTCPLTRFCFGNKRPKMSGFPGKEFKLSLMWFFQTKTNIYLFIDPKRLM